MHPLVVLMAAFLIGWAFVWVIARSLGAKCPACRLHVPTGATKCGHCGTDLPGPAIHPLGDVAKGMAVVVILVLPAAGGAFMEQSVGYLVPSGACWVPVILVYAGMGIFACVWVAGSLKKRGPAPPKGKPAKPRGKPEKPPIPGVEVMPTLDPLDENSPWRDQG